MSGNYTRIHESEMRTLLEAQGFKEVKIDGTREIVYGKIMSKNLCLRVYTSVAYGESRGCGSDAIRVCLVYRKADGSIVGVGSDTKVYRIETWKKNLMKRLEKWDALKSPDCPLCASPMRVKRGPWNDFWGCIEYPECRGTCQT